MKTSSDFIFCHWYYSPKLPLFACFFLFDFTIEPEVKIFDLLTSYLLLWILKYSLKFQYWELRIRNTSNSKLQLITRIIHKFRELYRNNTHTTPNLMTKRRTDIVWYARLIFIHGVSNFYLSVSKFMSFYCFFSYLFQKW